MQDGTGPLFGRLLLGALNQTARERRRRGPLLPSWSAWRELLHRILWRAQTHAAELGRTDGYPAARAYLERLSAQQGLAPGLRLGVRIEGVRCGAVPALLLRPRRGAERGLLYLHGGAYLFGSSGTYREQAARLALAARAEVLLPDYRLRPEHPIAASLEDARSALAFLRARHPGERVSVAGDSAGANLAVRLCIAEREAGAALPACAALLCPWVDLSAAGGSRDVNEPFDILPRSYLDGWTAVVLAGGDARDPAVSPRFADLRGLPPLLVQVGTAEVLLDQVREFAARAQEQGVETVLREWTDEPHDWHLLARYLGSGRAAIEEVAAFLRARA